MIEIKTYLRLVPIWYLAVFDSIRYLMLATQIPSNTWVFDGIWVANSSCWYICILVGFVRINRMDGLEQMWSPSFVAASCPLEKEDNLSIQGCQSYPGVSDGCTRVLQYH